MGVVNSPWSDSQLQVITDTTKQRDDLQKEISKLEKDVAEYRKK